MKNLKGIKIVNINEYDYSKIDNFETIKRPVGKNYNKRHYVNNFLTFDIECSRIQEIEQSFMYIWQCFDGDVCIIGRKWDEWFEFLKNIKNHLKGRFMVIYVHNLSYEGHFLSGYYDFENDEVFCTDKRRFLKMDMFDCFEYRCSMQLSNMSLENYLKTYNVENLKTKLDYNKIRYPDDELNDDEMLYCINDVVGLHQAIEKQMKLMNVNLFNIPLTSTGFPRKDIKRAMQKYNHVQLLEMQPNEEIYSMMRDAFRGGNTHANRFFANEILENVTSYDRVSSYPDVMLNHLFPMKPFKLTAINDIKRVIELMNKNKSLLIEIALFDVELKNAMFGCPYLSTHKCRNTKDAIIDNGRIISCSYTETTLTDIDLKILLDIYKFSDSYVIKCAYSNYAKLPEMYREIVMKYYEDKTKLKGDDKILYSISKSLLNALYGMSVQDIAKQNILFDRGLFNEDTKTLEYLLERNRRKAFSFYGWGVFISAWARYELHKMIMQCGDKFVYCDTDSVFFIGNVDFTEYNEKQKQICIENNSYAYDKNGQIYYLGMLECDKKAKFYKTLGAKKYGYIDEKGNLKITIAGVNKKKGAEELLKYGGLDAMCDGFIFNESGGNDAIYNDDDFGWYEKDEHKILITKNITIRPSSYTLGLTGDYMRILLYSKKLKYNPKGYKGA